jgi:hypothetical protein
MHRNYMNVWLAVLVCCAHLLLVLTLVAVGVENKHLLMGLLIRTNMNLILSMMQSLRLLLIR